jgi:hypothetical protein
MKACPQCGLKVLNNTALCECGYAFVEAPASMLGHPGEPNRTLKQPSPLVPPPPLPEPGWFDQQFLSTPRWALVLGGLCLAGPVFILGLLGLALCKNAKARENAVFVTWFGAVVVAVSFLAAVGLNLVLWALNRTPPFK